MLRISEYFDAVQSDSSDHAPVLQSLSTSESLNGFWVGALPNRPSASTNISDHQTILRGDESSSRRGVMLAAARLETRGLILAVLLGLTGSAAADEVPETTSSADHLAFFESRIRPVLIQHCYSCHSADSKDVRGGLLLDTRAGLLQGGDSGPAIIPGKPAESPLISALKHETVEMPPDQKLSETVIRDFEQWIASGATDPREGESRVARRTIDVEAGRSFWSFRPLNPVEVPSTGDSWARSDVDQFLIQKQQQTLGPEPAVAPDANADVILRRLYLILTGLLPSLDEQRQFSASFAKAPEAAIAAEVDRLLASPRFGERWGRHWLDVARYAESTGGGRSMMLPDAWRFRDYVIRSFNSDKPFDQLIREHLAGDLLPSDSDAQHDEQVIGSGYLMLGAINYEEQDKEQLRMDVVDEQIDSMGRTFLGMTLGCCRCHDHKFDPIPTADYYALAGIFRSTKSLTPGNVCGFVTRPLRVGYDKPAVDAWEQKDRELTNTIASLRKRLNAAGKLGKANTSADRPAAPALAELDGVVVDDSNATFAGTWVDSSFQQPFVGDGYRHSGQPRTGTSATYETRLPVDGEYFVRMVINHADSRSDMIPLLIAHADGESIVSVSQRQRPNDGVFATIGRFRFESERPAQVVVRAAEASPGYVICDAIQFIPADQMTKLAEGSAPGGGQETLSHAELETLRTEVKTAEEAKKEHDKLKPDMPVAMSVEDEKQPGDWHLHVRGEIRNLGPVVPRGYIQVATPPAMNPRIDAEAMKSAVGSESGRRQLAEWVASPQNPLPARVYVNRVWQHVFGEGLVRTPDNFGETGERPDHPELLDYLAYRFVYVHHWSTKALIRELCLSRAFRMSSFGSEDVIATDPENRLLTHSHRRRMDAESLRDALLQISGELNLSITSGRTIAKLATYDNEYRHESHPLNVRSVFIPAFRNTILDVFEIFDGANPNLVSGRRTRSTRPAQALYLLNSPFVMDQARKAAQRFVDSSGVIADDPEESVRHAIRCCLCREGTSDEVVVLTKVVGEDVRSADAWTQVFHALFASVDFRFVD